MKNIYTYLMIGLLCLAAVGCESKLDIEKHGNLGGIEDFYQTDDDAEQAIAEVYLAWGGAYYNWFFTLNLLSDDTWCGGGGRGDNSEMEMLNEYTFGTDHSMVQSLYSSMYSIIYYANLVIEKVTPDTDVKARACAEAKFFRGWAHFQLASLFGTAPVVDHLLGASEYRQSNSTTEELWAQVESDLTDAIDSGYLVSKSNAYDEENTIRITKEAAEAMLGKAYLFQEKYSEAASMLDKVIDSGLYELYTGDYDQLCHASTNNCCEAMLEVQKRNDAEKAWVQFTMTYIMMGWRTESLTMVSPASSEISSGTYGFFNPREELYDAFVATEGADGYRLKSTIRTPEQMEEYGVTVTPGKVLYGHEGYFNWKNRALATDVVYDASYFQALQYIDLRVMRYAEVLLMAAEANLQAGNTSKALSYVNQIRTRAQLSSLSSVTMGDIKNEKRLELCFEGTRYQDLVRWGDAASALGNQGGEIPGYSSTGVTTVFTNSTYGFESGKNELLPIPLKEIELNPNMSQNTGW